MARLPLAQRQLAIRQVVSNIVVAFVRGWRRGLGPWLHELQPPNIKDEIISFHKFLDSKHNSNYLILDNEIGLLNIFLQQLLTDWLRFLWRNSEEPFEHRSDYSLPTSGGFHPTRNLTPDPMLSVPGLQRAPPQEIQPYKKGTLCFLGGGGCLGQKKKFFLWGFPVIYARTVHPMQLFRVCSQRAK